MNKESKTFSNEKVGIGGNDGVKREQGYEKRVRRQQSYI